METAPSILPPEFHPLLSGSRLGAAPLAWLPPSEVLDPYRQLLVHDRDMSSALAGFHGDAITLTVLRSRQIDDCYFREVTLHTAAAGTPVEYGLIKIHLELFPAEFRPQILEGKTPYGLVLNATGLAYRSEPQGFFSVSAAPLHALFPQCSGGEILFGRYNHLVVGENTLLARIIEILPPTACLRT